MSASFILGIIEIPVYTSRHLWHIDRVETQELQMTKTTDIAKLASKIRKSSVFEDRLEYSVEDLAIMYALTIAEAKKLFIALHI